MSEEAQGGCILVCIVFFLCLVVAWCLCTRISPGYCGVVVNMTSETDVEPEPIDTGYHLILPNKSVWVYPLFEQNFSFNKVGFQTKEGLTTYADVGVTFNVERAMTPTLLRKFRCGIDEIAERFVFYYLKDAINVSASRRGVSEMYSDGKEGFLLEVEQTVRDKLSPMGINLSRVYLLGQFHLPQKIIEALDRKMEAAQRAEQRHTEIMEATAEAEKQVAAAHGVADSRYIEAESFAKSITIKAEAEAKANKIVAESLTDTLIRYESVKSWDGKLPQVVSDKNMPILQMVK